MASSLRKAPAVVRERIADALRDPARCSLDANSSSRSYLDRWDLRADGLFADLADAMECDDLYLKPKNDDHQPQRYQCVLAYPAESGLPAVDVHVTLSPKGEPVRVKVAVHPSDTVQTLPRIHVPLLNDEKETPKP